MRLNIEEKPEVTKELISNHDVVIRSVMGMS